MWLGNTVLFGIIVTRLFYSKFQLFSAKRYLERKEKQVSSEDSGSGRSIGKNVGQVTAEVTQKPRHRRHRSRRKHSADRSGIGRVLVGISPVRDRKILKILSFLNILHF